MKKIFTLFVAIAATSLALSAQPSAKFQARANAALQRLSAQQKPQRIGEEDIMAACPDSIVTWDTNDAGELVPNTKNAFTYDNKKRVVTEAEYDWAEGSWKLTAKTTNTYNGDVLVYKTMENHSEWGGTQLTRVTYTYDDAGNVVYELTQTIDGENLYNNSRTEYIYDEQGRVTAEVEESWDGESWECTEKSTTTFEGDKVTTTTYSSESGWMPSSYSVIYVNAQGLPYREEAYEQNEETGEFELASVSEITFDANGMPVSMKLLYNMGGGELIEMGSGTFSYEYNAQGLPTKSISTMHIDFFGMFTEDTTSVTYYYYGDGAHVDNAAVEPVVTSRRYYGMDGKEATGAVRGLYIVVTEYADGSRTAVKSVRR